MRRKRRQEWLFQAGLWALAAGAAASAGAAHAQAARSAENVVRQAEDAFGTNVGRESLGLYSSQSVRGFSPTVAGNARIDGLYFDQVSDIDGRLRRATVIRVGFSAFGFAFPAPTGVVDYQLRRPGPAASRSAFVGIDSNRGASLETDAVIPLNPALSLGVGAGLENSEFPNGTNAWSNVVGVHALWKPVANLEVLPFFVRDDIHDNDAGPSMAPAGKGLPPYPGRRNFLGPQWATSDGSSYNYGSMATWTPGPAWSVRAGLFRSVNEDGEGYSNLMAGVTPEGVGRQIISIDPPNKAASTSGELRVSRTHIEGPRLHRLVASVRGRARDRTFGGQVDLDLGLISIFERQQAVRPNVTFGPQSSDRVRQWIAGLAYEGRWLDRGELSLGLQKVGYELRTAKPGLPLAVTDASPLLWNAALSVNLTKSVAVYGATTRGLEESGVAPAAAVNRNTALPAIETRQKDAGIRWRIRPGLNLIGGAFDIRKPYSNLDEVNIWRELGAVRNRGIEASLSGQVLPNLTLLAGAVLIDAEVTGDAVRLGRVGKRPVGSSPRTLLFNADWRPPGLEGFSVDIGVTHAGGVVASRDNSAIIPSRTTGDVGMRYRFKLAGTDSVLRVQVRNVTDEKGFSMRGAGAFGVINGRVVSMSLASDF